MPPPEPTSRVVWSEGEVHFSVHHKPDGSVTIMRSTDADNGPAQVVTLPRQAARAVAMEVLLPVPGRKE